MVHWIALWSLIKKIDKADISQMELLHSPSISVLWCTPVMKLDSFRGVFFLVLAL